MSLSFPRVQGAISSRPQLYAARAQTTSLEAATVSSLKATVAELPTQFGDARINEIANEILTLT